MSPVVIGSNFSLLENCRLPVHSLFSISTRCSKVQTTWPVFSRVVMPVREMVECKYSNSFLSAYWVLLFTYVSAYRRGSGLSLVKSVLRLYVHVSTCKLTGLLWPCLARSMLLHPTWWRHRL